MICSLQSTWQHLLANYSPGNIEFTGTLIIQLLTFWLPCAIYLLLDHFSPSFSQRHKLQSASKQPTRSEIFECLGVVLQNQALSTVFHASLIYFSAVMHRPALRLDSKLPSLIEVVWHLLACIAIREIMFYYSHRLLHIPRLYPKIHKVHHRFTAPVALAAQYCHPIEHIVANILPISLPAQLLKVHLLTFWLFMVFVLLDTSTVHSGYDFFAGAAKRHDLHHEKFLIYFGTVGVLDWFHQTDGSKKLKN